MTKCQSKVFKSFQINIMTKLAQNKFDSISLKNDFFVKWLVGYLIEESLPFKLIPMGAGVTKITLEGVCCPYCKGKGFFPISDDHEAAETETSVAA